MDSSYRPARNIRVSVLSIAAIFTDEHNPLNIMWKSDFTNG
jgi:hypothetical protein